MRKWCKRPASCSPGKDLNYRDVGSCARGDMGLLVVQNNTPEWNEFKINGLERVALQVTHSSTRGGDTRPPVWRRGPTARFSVGPMTVSGQLLVAAD